MSPGLSEELHRFLEGGNTRHQKAVKLARFLSPAVFVEPELVRAMRLEMLPTVDVGIEAELMIVFM